MPQKSLEGHLSSLCWKGDTWDRLANKYGADGMFGQQLRQLGEAEGLQVLEATAAAVIDRGCPTFFDHKLEALAPHERDYIRTMVAADDLTYCLARMSGNQYKPVRVSRVFLGAPVKVDPIQKGRTVMTKKEKAAPEQEQDMGTCHEFHVADKPKARMRKPAKSGMIEDLTKAATPSMVEEPAVKVEAQPEVVEAKPAAPAAPPPANGTPEAPPAWPEEATAVPAAAKAESKKLDTGKPEGWMNSTERDKVGPDDRIPAELCAWWLEEGRYCRNKAKPGSVFCGIHAGLAERQMAIGGRDEAKHALSIKNLVIRLYQDAVKRHRADKAHAAEPAVEPVPVPAAAPAPIERAQPGVPFRAPILAEIRDKCVGILAKDDPTGIKRLALAKAAKNAGLPIYVAYPGAKVGQLRPFQVTRTAQKSYEGGTKEMYFFVPIGKDREKPYRVSSTCAVYVDKTAVTPVVEEFLAKVV